MRFFFSAYLVLSIMFSSTKQTKIVVMAEWDFWVSVTAAAEVWFSEEEPVVSVVPATAGEVGREVVSRSHEGQALYGSCWRGSWVTSLKPLF